MTITPSEPVEILSDTRPFDGLFWVGLILCGATGVGVTALGIRPILMSIHELYIGDYKDPVGPYAGLIVGSVFVAIGLTVTFKMTWFFGRKRCLVQTAERNLVVRVEWPFGQVSLTYPFEDIKDIRVGSRDREGSISYYPEFVGRFWFKNPGISETGQRADPEIVVETIRNALLDAGWRPSS